MSKINCKYKRKHNSTEKNKRNLIYIYIYNIWLHLTWGAKFIVRLGGDIFPLFLLPLGGEIENNVAGGPLLAHWRRGLSPQPDPFVVAGGRLHEASPGHLELLFHDEFIGHVGLPPDLLFEAVGHVRNDPLYQQDHQAHHILKHHHKRKAGSQDVPENGRVFVLVVTGRIAVVGVPTGGDV